MTWDLTAVDTATRVGIRAEHVPAGISAEDHAGALSPSGIDVIAISAETREGPEQLQAHWKLERLPIAYGLTEPSMREWGLFVTRGRSDDEPPPSYEPLHG